VQPREKKAQGDLINACKYLECKEDYRIIEWFRLEGMFKRHLVQPFCSDQGQLPLYQSQNHRTTESQNGRRWKGPLWVIWYNPPVKAGSPTAGCTGCCPGGS